MLGYLWLVLSDPIEDYQIQLTTDTHVKIIKVGDTENIVRLDTIIYRPKHPQCSQLLELSSLSSVLKDSYL